MAEGSSIAEKLGQWLDLRKSRREVLKSIPGVALALGTSGLLIREGLALLDELSKTEEQRRYINLYNEYISDSNPHLELVRDALVVQKDGARIRIKPASYPEGPENREIAFLKAGEPIEFPVLKLPGQDPNKPTTYTGTQPRTVNWYFIPIIDEETKKAVNGGFSYSGNFKPKEASTPSSPNSVVTSTKP